MDCRWPRYKAGLSSCFYISNITNILIGTDPALQLHVLGSVHVPCTQAGEQIGTLQVDPVYLSKLASQQLECLNHEMTNPELQVHVFGSVHDPCTQLGEQTGIVQDEPV